MPKRLFDIAVASLALLVLAPLLMRLVWKIRRKSPGPIFDCVRRAGRGGIPFQMLVFRTAGPAAGNNTSSDSTLQQARKHKAEWLPQLVNVLRGDMSIVGPRPELTQNVDKYNWNEKRILAMRPGMIDWVLLWNRDERGVLAGAPDPEEAYERVIRPDRLRLELLYLDTHTVWGDLKILFVPIVRAFYRSYTPAELQAYPTFRELRAAVARLVATEQIYRTSTSRRAV